LKKEKRGRRTDGQDPKEKIVFREWRPEGERHSRDRREQTGEQVPRVENSLDHVRAAFAAA
jgi:hypothetical protein